MIFVSHRMPVNEPGEHHLSRRKVWKGLVLQASNPVPFIPAISESKIIAQRSANEFDREILCRGERVLERVVLEEQNRTVFTRLSGPVLGTIAHEIEESDGELHLRFSFALLLVGAESGSQEELSYAEETAGTYISALSFTLTGLRKMAIEENGSW